MGLLWDYYWETYGKSIYKMDDMGVRTPMA